MIIAYTQAHQAITSICDLLNRRTGTNIIVILSIELVLFAISMNGACFVTSKCLLIEAVILKFTKIYSKIKYST